MCTCEVVLCYKDRVGVPISTARATNMHANDPIHARQEMLTYIGHDAQARVVLCGQRRRRAAGAWMNTSTVLLTEQRLY